MVTTVLSKFPIEINLNLVPRATSVVLVKTERGQSLSN